MSIAKVYTFALRMHAEVDNEGGRYYTSMP